MIIYSKKYIENPLYTVGFFYFYSMKKILLAGSFFLSAWAFSQFTVKVTVPANLDGSEVYLYGFNGSKDILFAKGKASGNIALVKVDKRYVGMMRAFFPKANGSVNLISENKDVSFALELDGKEKISNVVFQDESNKLFSNEVDAQRKKELILPALIQIKDFYRPADSFYKSLDQEIGTLSKKDNAEYASHPFLEFYQNSQKFVAQDKVAELKPDDYINFFTKSGEFLETSGLMKAVLINYLNGSKANVEARVDQLLGAVNIETPRGQIVLSELIDLFNSYNMDKLRDKYLKEGNDLKCTINDRLASTLKANNNTEIGAQMPNNIFVNAVHSKYKSLHDVKAAKKVVVFWSSACSHCETELPKLLEKYSQLKAQNIEVIGLSLDSNLDDFKAKANIYPWISASEGKGWYSSYGDTYNVNATPTYFVLDSNNKIIAKPNHVGDVLSFLKIN